MYKKKKCPESELPIKFHTGRTDSESERAVESMISHSPHIEASQSASQGCLVSLLG